MAAPTTHQALVGGTVGQASAAKQSYALFNKGRLVLAEYLPAGFLGLRVMVEPGHGDVLGNVDHVAEAHASVGQDHADFFIHGCGLVGHAAADG